MTYQEVVNMVKEIKPDGINSIQFAYRAFEEGGAVAPPFICYLYTGNSPESADNKNHVKIEQLAIELYTDQKDFALEQKIETVLTSHDFVFDREEAWLSDERMQMTTYTMEVLING